PHIQIAVFNAQTFALIQQMQVWNPGYAYSYPALITNSREEVGMALMFGGGGTYHGSSAVGIWGDFIVWTPQYSTSSDPSRVGDYVTIRQYLGRDGTLYAASVYSRLSFGFNPIYILFGRRSDVP